MQEKHIPFEGGLQLVGTPLGRKPGTLLTCHNYEISIDGGYRRVDGYTALGQVPGSGPLRGLCLYAGVLYAFRDNADATECLMYAYDDSAWSVVTTPTLLPGGSYEFHIHNFTGASGTRMLYGVDGVNTGFSFDGTTFTQITTGMTVDTPTHLIGFKNHLFYAFEGGSVQHSSIGDPTTWTPLTGAGEIGVGDDIQGFSEEVGGSLFVFARDRINVITGTSSADWVMAAYSSDSGALAGTIKRLGQSTYLDDRGMLRLEASQSYGDFKAATFSQAVAPMLADLLKNSTVSCTQIVREKGQYRVFFYDGTILVATFVGNKLSGFTRSYFPTPMVCAESAEDADGLERVFYGDADGMVYEEGGNNFNGAAILNLIRLPYYHFGSPTRRKQFRRIFFEALTDGAISLSIAPSYNYGSQYSPRSKAVDLVNDLAGVQGYWDASNYGEFNWSVPFSPEEPVRIDGLGSNMSLLVSGSELNAEPHTLYGALVSFDYRGQKR